MTQTLKGEHFEPIILFTRNKFLFYPSPQTDLIQTI